MEFKEGYIKYDYLLGGEGYAYMYADPERPSKQHGVTNVKILILTNETQALIEKENLHMVPMVVGSELQRKFYHHNGKLDYTSYDPICKVTHVEDLTELQSCDFYFQEDTMRTNQAMQAAILQQWYTHYMLPNHPHLSEQSRKGLAENLNKSLRKLNRIMKPKSSEVC